MASPPPPDMDATSLPSSTESLSLELNTIYNEMAILNRFSCEEVISYLDKKREVLFYRFMVAVHYLVDHFYSEDKVSTAHNLLSSVELAVRR